MASRLDDRNVDLNTFFIESDDSTPRSTSYSPTPLSTDTMKQVTINVPTHPISSMQEAFAESMREASENVTPAASKQKLGNAALRRQILLDQDIIEETHATRWKQRPGQRYHELWKLMAQISFGIYLLLNGIAKNEEQVMNILQGHVDEIDEFLEITLEDFGLAQEDIDERLKFLKLPLENIHVFDTMLEDRQFRQQIVSGNERIEHVIQRTASAMKAALKDVKQGLDACKEFAIYLAEEQEDPVWRIENPDLEKVYVAMKGNVEGWYKAYVSLQTKGNHLGVALVQLGSIVAEMDRRTSEISRKTRFSTSPQSSLASPPTSPRQRQSRQSMSTILTSDANLISPAIQATLPIFQMVEERERTPEPEPQKPPTTDPELYILAPRTYTPIPSPQPPKAVVREHIQEEIQELPAPQIKPRSSLRNRFSLKRKEIPPPQQSQSVPDSRKVQEVRIKRPPQLSPVHSDFQPLRPQYQTTVSAPQLRTAVVQRPNLIQTPLSTPPSRGLDSAYCSDFEKPRSPPGPHPTAQSHQQHPTPQILASDFPIPSPRSEQQYFRPVNASPHSPLQRPWTAAPPGHVHTSSNLSNISNLSSNSTERNKSRLQFSTQNTPSQLGLRDQRRQAEYNDARRGELQSRMGMSIRSEMTMVTENGKKVKKKRSAFGWLKKAFALSEEEKAAFEQKRRQVDYQDHYFEPPAVRWVDGKRVGSMPSPSRSEFSRTAPSRATTRMQ